MKAKSNVALVVLDAGLISGGYLLAYHLKYDFSPPPEAWILLRATVIPILVLKLLIYHLFGLYRVIWPYLGMVELRAASSANCLVSVLLLVVLLVTRSSLKGLFILVVLDGLLAILLVGGSRAGIRLAYEFLSRRQSVWKSIARPARRKRAVIIGAGEAGEKIYREIRDNPRVAYNVIGFLDDNRRKVGLSMHGLPVLGNVDALEGLAQRGRLDEVIVAIKAVPGGRMRRIVEICQRYGIESRTIPVLGDILNRQVMINRTRPVKYEDLLGRQPVEMHPDRIGRYLQGKNILITGGAGSIGSELCRQAARFDPKSLVICDNCENSLYEIEIELTHSFGGVHVVPVLADVRDAKKMDRLFARVTPDVVFHAAAYKHVPMMESHAWEAVENNVVGTLNVLQTAERTAVERFVLVSSDKAVKPSSVMGATKRVAELLTLAFSGEEKRRFVIVRFGNVAGSEGSVIPLFRRQIERGGPVTVTHPEITRYFMTIPEAAQLILEAGGMGEGGEIFVLDMGTPLKIVDIARDLIRFAGMEPNEDIKIHFTGLRPGEKLAEEIVRDGEGVRATAHEKISAIVAETGDRAQLLREVRGLLESANRCDGEGVRSWLKRIVPDYRPQDNGGAPA